MRSRSVFDKLKSGLTEMLHFDGPKFSTQNLKPKTRNVSNVADIFDPNTYKKIDDELPTEGPEDKMTSITDIPLTQSTPKKFTFKKTIPQTQQTDTQQTKVPVTNSDGSPNSPQVFENNNSTFRGFNLSPNRSVQGSESPTFSPVTRKSTMSRKYDKFLSKYNSLRLEKC